MTYTIEQLYDLMEFLNHRGPTWENRGNGLIAALLIAVDVIYSYGDPEVIREELLARATAKQKVRQVIISDWKGQNHPLYDLYHILYDDIKDVPLYVDSACAFLIRWRMEHEQPKQ